MALMRDDYLDQRQLVPQRPVSTFAAPSHAVHTMRPSTTSATWWYSQELIHRLTKLRRDERGMRKRIQEQQQTQLEDCMFVAAQTRSLLRKLAAEAKAQGIVLSVGKGRHAKSAYSSQQQRQHPAAASAANTTTKRAGSPPQEQVPAERIAMNQLFYPQSPPRPVSVGFRQVHRCMPPKLPYADVFRVVSGEESMRCWIEGLEAKLRDPLVQECVHSWWILTGTGQIEASEAEMGQELRDEELREWLVVLRREYKARPPSVHLALIVRQTQAASPKVVNSDADELVVDATTTVEKVLRREACFRRAIEKSEDAAIRACFAWLNERYAVRMFSTVRCEDLARVDIEEQADEALAKIQQVCRPRQMDPAPC